MTIEITDDNFDSIITSDKPILIDFWAEWCGPCKMIGPSLEELSETFQDKVIIGKVNVDTNSALTAKYGIRSIPALLFFKNGEIVDKQVGAVAKSVLSKKLDTILHS